VVLQKIQNGIAEYVKWLKAGRHHPRTYKWETLQHFQTHWKPDDPDPVAMLERCFYNSETRRLWHTDNWYPLRMMSEFWRMDAATVRWMFDDLFNETKDTEARIGRFLFGCDSLLRDYKELYPAKVENNHYHGDYRMIALYLAFRYPEAYAPYDFQAFRQTLVRVGARDIPQENDIGRYFKVLRTLMTFLEKDPSVMPALQKHLHPRRHFDGKTLLLAEDFCCFMGQE
jgi:hypothetical protein